MAALTSAVAVPTVVELVEIGDKEHTMAKNPLCIKLESITPNSHGSLSSEEAATIREAAVAADAFIRENHAKTVAATKTAPEHIEFDPDAQVVLDKLAPLIS